jgi:hypothetical protein
MPMLGDTKQKLDRKIFQHMKPWLHITGKNAA